MASAGRKHNGGVAVPDWVSEALECPVCLETIKDPPVFLCTNGHELCHTCRERHKTEGKPCPVCKGELTDTRARAVERMLEKLPKTQCKHEGCTFSRADAQVVKSHEEKECRLKPVKCDYCHQRIALSQLHDHMVAIHKKVSRDFRFGEVMGMKNLYAGCYQSIRSYLGNYQVLFRDQDSDLKFFMNWKCFDTNLTMVWISFAGTQVEAEEYDYTLKIRHPTERREDRQYLFTGTRICESCDVSREDMRVKGSALFLNKALLESASVSKEKDKFLFDLRFLIRKKK